MSDPERAWSRGKVALGGLAVVAVFGTIVLVRTLSSGREEPPTEAAPAPSVAPKPAPAQVQAPPLPLPPPPVGRAGLLSAVRLAASNHSAGRAAGDGAEPLAGRRLRLAIPFGCMGPRRGEDDAWAWWEPVGREGAIRIRVRPEDWRDSAFFRELGGKAKWEAVEGFWLPRPWSDSEDCPVTAVDPLQTARAPASPQTVGLVSLFEEGGSRVRQRGGRPYEVTVNAPDATATEPALSGYRVVLEGRFGTFPDGGAIRCRATGPDERPVCLAAVEIERLSIQDPRTGAFLGEWGS